MAVPASRNDFKEYCLRRLGKPVIEINVDDDQVEDRVDEAIRYYWDYHFDGSEKTYYKHEISSTDKTNKYITLPENIIGVVSVFPISDPSIRSDDLFNIRYQIALNDLYTLTNVSLVPYYMAMEHLSLLTEMLVGRQPVRYTRHRDRCYIDMDWNVVNEGEFLLIEAYEVIDPDTFTDVWGDRWLQNYTTALIKRQWGNNLTKFSGMVLPGGVQFNGDRILSDAQAEIEKMEADMISSYSLPVTDMVG
jgi:hypothetical protein